MCNKSPVTMNKLKDQFVSLRSEREREAEDHEKSRSWEMSYISYWSILEEGLKLFAIRG